MIYRKLTYLLGKSKNELSAYDEYDSDGSGKWYTDNPIMANEHNYKFASNIHKKAGLNVYSWEVFYDTNEKNITGWEVKLLLENKCAHEGETDWNRNTVRTKLEYLLGKSETELLAYDTYKSEEPIEWFTDNPIMAKQYKAYRPCYEDAKKLKLDSYMWEIGYDIIEKKIVKNHVSHGLTVDEATERLKDGNN